MIPLQLKLSGFLSYHDPVTLDFRSFDLACISGPNGAGKSSLLDAITWALFGQARKRDDSIIHTSPLIHAAEVTLIFVYEGNIYRVQRINPRGKSTVLEFNILQALAPDDVNTLDLSNIDLQQIPLNHENIWKSLSERSLRETQSRIESVLRMDYETFVNASFFLQGKADQFTQQRPGDRKRILGSILGLEVWDIYRQRAQDARREVEGEISIIDSKLVEIEYELGEDDARKNQLGSLESDLNQLVKLRTQQENVLENYRIITSTINEQRKLVEALRYPLEATERQLGERNTRLGTIQQEIVSYTDLINRAEEIETAYTAWQVTRDQLTRWNESAKQFHDKEILRQNPLNKIQVEQARLLQEREQLEEQRKQVEANRIILAGLDEQILYFHTEIAFAEERLQRRKNLETLLEIAQKKQSEIAFENKQLKATMDDLVIRIDTLEATTSAECPTCGQALNFTDRQMLINELRMEGKSKGDTFRSNREELTQVEQRIKDMNAQIKDLANTEKEIIEWNEKKAKLNSQKEQGEVLNLAWKVKGALRLEKINLSLEKEDFCPEARLELKNIDESLRSIGYDAAAHDELRERELSQQSASEEYLDLERARAALDPLQREVVSIQGIAENLEKELSTQRQAYDQAVITLAATESQAPDIEIAERELLTIQEQENRLRMEIGAAHQKVEVLKDLKKRRKSLNEQRIKKTHLVSDYKQLERAFGKDGIPALLIEQALPEIEERANLTLDRLTNGEMSVRFVTQTAYKDKLREDLRETLEIQISDASGYRDYEMFSGGEAFRINFAIRLALSEILASRAGARLQTLVIDEGFGSQDVQGRQRLIETINLVRQDFAKILVITHVDELKEAFPLRIDIRKTEHGSTISLV